MKRIIPKTLLFALTVLLAAPSARAASITWTNAAGGNWNTATNWSPNTVPSSGDNATIILNGTYTVTLNANANIGSLTLGAASGTQTFAFGAGTALTLNESSTVASNAVFNLSGGGATRSLVVQSGTLTLGGSGTFGGDVTVKDSAVLNFAGAYSLNSGATFAGAGVIRVDPFEPDDGITVNGNITIRNLVLGSLGIATVASGTLTVTGIGSSAGSFTVASGAALSFKGAFSWNSGTSFAGAGAIRVDPSTPCCSVIVNGSLSVPNLEVGSFGALNVASGTLTLTGIGSSAGSFTVASGAALSFKGAFSWNSGTSFAGAGAIRVNPGDPCCTVTVNGSLSVPNLELGNFGALNVASGALTVTGSGSSAGSFTVASGAALSFKGGFSWNSGASFAGAGAIRVDPSQPCCDVTVNGSLSVPNLELGGFGALNVASGTLTVAGIGSSAGSFTVAGGAVLSFKGGFSWNSGTSFAGAGAIRVDPIQPCCTVTVNGSVSVPNLELGSFGALNVASGTLTVTGIGSSTGSFTVASGAALSFKGGFSWNSGTSFAGAGAIRVDPSEPCCTVTVNGSLSVPNLNVGSFGALNVASGTLTLAGGGTSAGRFSVTLGAALHVTGDYFSSTTSDLNVLIGGLTPGTQYNQAVVTGAASISGTLNLQLANGFVPSLSNSFQILTYGSHSGTFSKITGQNLGNGLYLKPVYQSTGLLLVATDGAPGVDATSLSLSNGQFHFRLTGAAGNTYVTEASTDLTTWLPISTNTLSGSSLDVVDGAAGSFARRFYRAVLVTP